jgi:hypothetical protein
MLILHILAFAGGLVIAAGTIFSAIETFVVPRSVQDSLTRLVFSVIRLIFALVLRRAKSYESRDRVMSYYAPIALIALLPTWYTLVLLGFTLMFWGLGASSLLEAFRESGSSLLTLGFAAAAGFGHTALTFIEAAVGLILVALLISYLPTMYSAFSRREAAVTMLEVRAGNPPSAIELILRYNRIHGLERLRDLWVVWEAWFADVEESHSSLTPLVFFRSPQPHRSWVTAAGAVLDAASLTISVVDIPHEAAADLCIRAGYITLRRIGEFFGATYNPNVKRGDPISISRQEFNEACATLAEKGVPVKTDLDEAWLNFTGWRANYDQSLLALASVTMAPFAPWSSDRAIQVGLPPIAHLKKHIEKKT